MKVPKIRLINDWYEIDDYIHIDFMMDIDYHNQSFGEYHSRILNIDLSEVESYVDKCGLLTWYEDEWDYLTESVYQTYKEITFEEWMDDFMDDLFIKDLLEYYIDNNGNPDIFILE